MTNGINKQKGKLNVPEDPESDPLLSDSSSSKYDFSNNTKYRKSKSKGCDTKKKHWKLTKQDLLDSFVSDSGSFNEYAQIIRAIGKRTLSNYS